MDLKINKNDRKLWVATHGNGAYNIDLESSSVSTDELEDIAIGNTVLYPNPASDQLFIKNDALVSRVDWKIFSLSGQLLSSGSGKSADVSDLANGNYLFQISHKGSTSIERFVVLNN